MLGIFCSTFEEKLKLIFKMYDFNQDDYITEQDVITLMSSMPVVSSAEVEQEGRYTKEGGGAQTFQERVDTLEEMLTILK